MPVDDSAFLFAFDALITRVQAAGPKAGNLSAQLLKATGMKRTPVLSGTLRRSWKVDVTAGIGVYAARVGPTMIYARRQELGFKGPDSIGRVYKHDPGWPYVRPAQLEALPKIQALTKTIYTTAIGG